VNQATRHFACRVTGLERATGDIRILRLAPPVGARFEFRAGQYAKLGFGTLPPRDYSMANAPHEPLLEFHIRDVGDGASRYAVRRLALGEAVTVDGPMGDAYLRPEHPGAIIAIAGGSGLAPMKSIVETALHLGLVQQVHLYFGVRTERDLYLVGRFEQLAATHGNFRFVPVIAEPAAPRRWRSGLVGDAVLADIENLAGCKAYLAGPPPMVETAISQLHAHGLAAADIHADPFYSDEENRRRLGGDGTGQRSSQ
jgi:CDP-4-dehydro-6-deoxyglucose reductase/ferredoxin-NAD(P)+ reductase (naphthalene dioxygenase ferredoxin-specific)